MTSYWTNYSRNKAEYEELMDLDNIIFSDKEPNKENYFGEHSNGHQDFALHENPNLENQSENFNSSNLFESPESQFSSDESLFSATTHIINTDLMNYSDILIKRCLRTDLRDWTLKHHCPRAWLNDLLVILRNHGNNLPKDYRTLLQTPRQTTCEKLCGGDFKYFGIEYSIINALVSFAEFPLSIELKVNVDGVPLWKSSPEQFWPILGMFDQSAVFIIGIYYGKQKPNNIENFLGRFLDEMTILEKDGIELNGQNIKVSLKCFICDAPARSFLKNTILHCGYHSCERCCIKGSYTGRVVFNSTQEVPMRTDENFSIYAYEKHQKGETPLVVAGVKCISQFPLDYMHLVCLGVTKRILKYLKEGPYCCKLSSVQINQVSKQLLSFNGKLPSEFARQPRSMSEWKRWKATELRQFLLYTGPLVLADIMKPEMYVHFLTLSLAISILLVANVDRRTHYLGYARDLLKYFVSNCQRIYGPTFTVYNVHGLLHLCDDVESQNCSLNELSAFPFENYLQSIKKMVRNSRNPVVQVSNRIQELNSANIISTRKKNEFKLSTKPKDSCFSTESKIMFIKRIKANGDYVCDGVKFSRVENLFWDPVSSKTFNIAFIKNGMKLKEQIIKKRDVLYKCVCLPFKEGKAIMPLLHEFNEK